MPPWPLPKLFRMVTNGVLNEDIFRGWTINTPSMLCVEDYLFALNWAKEIGGLPALIGRADANAKIVSDWVMRTAWVDFLARDERLRSNTSVCLKIVDPKVAALPREAQARFIQAMTAYLEEERAAFGHRRASRCATRPAHLVRPNGGACKSCGFDALARPCVREDQGRLEMNGRVGSNSGAMPFTAQDVPTG